MPDSTGFGDYTESGQVIPVSFRGRKRRLHPLHVPQRPPAASPAAASSGAFPRSWRSPTLRAEIDTLVGTLDYGPVRVATGTMGYKHRQADLAAVKASLAAPNFLLKIIPHVDGTPRICELVEYYLEDVELKGAWTGPAALDLRSHALAPVAELPVLEVVSAHAHRRRSDARPRQGRPRLPRAIEAATERKTHDFASPTLQADRSSSRHGVRRTRSPSSPAPRAASARRSRSTFAREGAKVVDRGPRPDGGADATAAEIDRRGSARSASPWMSPTRSRSRPASRRWSRPSGALDILVSNAGIQIVAPGRRVRVRQVEEAAGHPPRRRLPDHPGRLRQMYRQKSGSDHLHGLGALQGGVAAEGALRHGQARSDRPGQGGGQGRGGARRPRQRDLPRLRAHAAGREADPRAGARSSASPRRRCQERDAEGDRRRRVHDRRGRGRDRAVLRRVPDATR